jgi:hypothetical protein
MAARLACLDHQRRQAGAWNQSIGLAEALARATPAEIVTLPALPAWRAWLALLLLRFPGKRAARRPI